MVDYFLISGLGTRPRRTKLESNCRMSKPPMKAAHDMALGALVDAVMEDLIDQHFAVEVHNGMGRVLEVTAVFNSTIFRKQ